MVDIKKIGPLTLIEVNSQIKTHQMLIQAVGSAHEWGRGVTLVYSIHGEPLPQELFPRAHLDYYQELKVWFICASTIEPPHAHCLSRFTHLLEVDSGVSASVVRALLSEMDVWLLAQRRYRKLERQTQAIFAAHQEEAPALPIDFTEAERNLELLRLQRRALALAFDRTRNENQKLLTSRGTIRKEPSAQVAACQKEVMDQLTELNLVFERGAK